MQTTNGNQTMLRLASRTRVSASYQRAKTNVAHLKETGADAQSIRAAMSRADRLQWELRTRK